MFITLEGIEGSGKTTQMKNIVSFLEKRGTQCITTREPGGTFIGEKIRAILLSPENKELHPMSELLLYMADRAQHLHTLVKPSLSKGVTVLCDRYFDATLVYQGYARGIDIGLIEKMHQLLLEDFKPNITFLLDLPPQVGLGRAWQQLENGSRVGAESRFEEETLTFHEKVRSGYLELARREPDRFQIIDAAQNQEHVRTSILAVLAEIGSRSADCKDR